mgnify:CR=1 FL=1|tara:strand:- start:15125 stop:16174 length:1050 start_codon:yes stop_codon:yes gene_type:complete
MSAEEDRYEKYKGKGLTGLANLGNSCYKNSCMQILSHTYPLNEILNNEEYKKRLNKIPDSILLVEWDKLRTLMWSENCTVSPAGWNQATLQVARLKNNDIFLGYGQNDLAEFLYFIIDSFHNSLKREVEMNIKGNIKNERDKLAKSCFEMMKNMYRNEYSEILKIFYGIHVSQIVSDNKQVLGNNPEPYFMIDLPIVNKQNVNIIDCLEEYIKPERLEGENAWYNEKTKKKENVSKGLVFFSFPEILVLTIKRFNNNSQKDSRVIDFPLKDLDLSKYCKGYNKDEYKYDLYAVCNHSGAVEGGHYTSHIKNANGLWYNFNDTTISKITNNIEKYIVTNEAYCLFYEKKN